MDRVDVVSKRAEALSVSDAVGGTVPFDGYRILSYNGDEMGKVLTKDGRIFRGVYAESADWFKKLWSSGLIQALAAEGIFPETTITEYKTDEFPIILEHKKIEISTAKMWNPIMVRDACITISLVDMVCRRFGYRLIDGHLNNITFASGRPVFTDIGSIVVDRGQYTSYESSLIFAGGYKLIASSLGNSILSRIQFFDENNNAIWPAPFNYDESTCECRHLLKKFRRWHFWHSSLCARKLIFRLFELGQVRPEYFELIFPNIPYDGAANGDYSELLKAVGDLNVESVTLVGGPCRLGEELHDALGCRTVVLDHTVAASEYSYQNSKDISCYCYNYLYGGDADTLNCIRSRLAVVNNITENLISYQNWKLESLFNGVSKLTTDYVAVSFRLGCAANRCVDSAKDSYSGFESKFSSFFDLVKVVDCGDFRVYVGRLRGIGKC